MKVLYFHQHFGTPQGATATRSYEFSKALIAAGHSVTVVCGSNERAALDLPLDTRKGYFRGCVDGIDVISLPLVYSNSDGLIKRAQTFLRYALSSVSLALGLDYDLLFATSTPLTAGIPGIAGRVFRRKPFVFEVRDLWPDLPRALGMRNPFLLAGMSALELATYLSSQACIGLAPGIVEGIKQRSQRGKPVAMIPNGCDLRLFKPAFPECESRREASDFVAVFCGAHGPANGLGAVLEGAAALKKRSNTAIKIVFVGDGKEKPRLVASAESQGLDNCLFLPTMRKTELATYLRSVDCGLMILKNVPAFYFGTSPNKFFDYISSGIPVLNNYPGWLANIVHESRCGLVVPPEDPELFADALEHLASCPEQCRRMGSNARKLAEEEFSRDQLSAQFVAFLETQFDRARSR